MAIDVLKQFIPGIKEHGITTDSDVTLTGSVSITAAGTGAATALAATGDQALDASTSSLFTIAPTAALTLTISGSVAGQEITIIVDSVDTDNRVVTFGTGFQTTGTLGNGTAADRRFVMKFVSNGTSVIEASRTTAITTA